MSMRTSSRLGASAEIAGRSAFPSRLAAFAGIAGRPALSSRLGAVAGAAGPAAFTCAWIVASLRQPGHSPVAIQLSGLAAPDARDPGIMIAGFVVLGGCSIAFGRALHRALGGSSRYSTGTRGVWPRSRARGLRVRAGGPRGHAGRPRVRAGGPRVDAGGAKVHVVGPKSRLPDPGPRGAGLGPHLIQWAGALTIAAGLMRRDHMMLGPPGGAAGESWHNHAHDLVSSIIYVILVVTPLLLAVRFRGDPNWRRLCAPLVGGSAATAGLLGVFASSAFGSWDPILQRVAVTIPLAMLTAVAVRLLAQQTAGA